MAANHLLELGHRRLGALIGTAKSAKDGACYRGFRHQLTRFGVAHDASDARFGISGIDEGRLAASQLLSATRDLTAIFATSDLVAAGAVHAAKDLGLSVPEHLTVCGVGDTELACRISADFSTVAIGSAEVAENAVKLALDLISGTQPMLGAARTVTPGPSPRLIVRASAHARPTAPSDGKTWR
jgi:DNA-binding LacI/PurR family transcriptional regulator